MLVFLSAKVTNLKAARLQTDGLWLNTEAHDATM